MRLAFGRWCGFGLAMLALAVTVSGARGQEGWPSVGMLWDQGQPVSAMTFGPMVSIGSTVIGMELGAGSFGVIFRCNGAHTPIIHYDAPFSRLETGTCRQLDSAVCLKSESQAEEECYAIRQIPGYNILFAAFAGPDGARLDADAGRLSDPAIAVGFSVVDIYSLAAASGAVESSTTSVTLPPGYRFALTDARPFPLTFQFVANANEIGLGLQLQLLRWPDMVTVVPPSPEAHTPMAALARQTLEAVEQIYRDTDVQNTMTGARYRRAAYRAAFTEEAGGPCVTIHETVAVQDTPAGVTVHPQTTIQTQKICISVADRVLALLMVDYADPPPDQPVEDIEDLIAGLIDTFRMKDGTIGLSDEVSFERFLALQGGDPDLAWEMLDCVQGWNRAAQVNGCNHSITRYARVVDVGEALIADAVLSEDQTTTVRDTIEESLHILAIVYTVRAKLLAEEAPAQSNMDCYRALDIARRLEDPELIDIASDCP